jgi:hypothetical protein
MRVEGLRSIDAAVSPDRPEASARTPAVRGEAERRLIELQRLAGNAAVTGLLGKGPALQRLMLTAERNRGGVPKGGIEGIRREDPDGARPQVDFYDDSQPYGDHSKIYLVGHGRPGRFDGNSADTVGDRLTRPGKGIDREGFVLLTLFSCQTGKELAPGLGANFASELNNTLHDRGYIKVETTAPKGDIIVVGDRWLVVDEPDVDRDNLVDEKVQEYEDATSTLARSEAMKQLLQTLTRLAREGEGSYYAAASLAALKREGAFIRLLSAHRIKGVLDEVRATRPQGLADYFS